MCCFIVLCPPFLFMTDFMQFYSKRHFILLLKRSVHVYIHLFCTRSTWPFRAVSSLVHFLRLGQRFDLCPLLSWSNYLIDHFNMLSTFCLFSACLRFPSLLRPPSPNTSRAFWKRQMKWTASTMSLFRQVIAHSLPTNTSCP